MLYNNLKNFVTVSIVSSIAAIITSFCVAFMYSTDLAIIDLPRILLKDSKVAIQVNGILEKYHTNISSLAEQIKTEISDLEKSLEGKKAKSGKTGSTAEEKKIQDLRNNLQVAFASYNYLNERVREAVRVEINKELTKIVPTIAQSRGYDYVINSIALYGYSDLNKNHKYDITEEVIKKLDDALPSINIKELTGLDLDTNVNAATANASSAATDSN